MPVEASQPFKNYIQFILFFLRVKALNMSQMLSCSFLARRLGHFPPICSTVFGKE